MAPTMQSSTALRLGSLQEANAQLMRPPESHIAATYDLAMPKS